MKFKIATALFARLRRRASASPALTCGTAEIPISQYADGMAGADLNDANRDSARIESHLAECTACRSEFESLTEMRSFLMSSPRPSPPARLELETRVTLSHARHGHAGEGCLAFAADMFRPLAIRAVLSVSASTVLFGALLIGVVSNQTATAHPGPDPDLHVYQPAQPTDTVKAWLAASEMEGLKAPLMIEAYVGADGYVFNFHVVKGVQTPETDRWIWDRLYFAQFSPATNFGVPVPSSVMLSFFAVKS